MASLGAVQPNTNVPGIPEPVADVNSLVSVARTMRQGLQSLSGARGDVLARAVTFRDLIAAGLVTEASLTSGSIPRFPVVYRAPAFWPGVPVVGQVGHRRVIGEPVVFPAGLPLSRATAGAIATGTALFSIRAARGVSAPNGFTVVGSITFTLSATAVLALAANLTLAAGDTLDIVCVTPGGVRDISIELRGVLG